MSAHLVYSSGKEEKYTGKQNIELPYRALQYHSERGDQDFEINSLLLDKLSGNIHQAAFKVKDAESLLLIGEQVAKAQHLKGITIRFSAEEEAVIQHDELADFLSSLLHGHS